MTRPYSLLKQLFACCEQGPELPALIAANGTVLSRRQLVRRVRNLAKGLQVHGLLPGDRVVFAVRPDAEAVLLMIAIAEAGGVLVPIDTHMGAALFKTKMELLTPRWIVAESVLLFASANRWILAWLARRGLHLPTLCELAGARYVRVGRRWPGLPPNLCYRTIEHAGQHYEQQAKQPLDQHFDTQTGEPGEVHGRPTSNSDDPVMIVFTSGSTAAPKAAVHTRGSMQGVFSVVGSLLKMRPEDVLYAHELHLILPALFAGASVVVPPRQRFSAKRVIQTMRKYRVSHYFSVATDLQQLLEYLQARKQMLPSTLREIWIGAAPVHASFLRRFKSVLPAETEVWCVYGMTEILPVARVSAFDKLRYQDDGLEKSTATGPGSGRGVGDLVGRCVPGVEARITPEGELALRGPNLFAGYFGETPCSEHLSGDLARIDEARIVLLGRRKDMIIRRRFNIYPALYEANIERIEGVRRCALVGVYDEALADERVILFVEPRKGCDPAALQQQVFKALRRGPFSIDADALPDEILTMALPVSGRSSKIDKQHLRELAQRKSRCA